LNDSCTTMEALGQAARVGTRQGRRHHQCMPSSVPLTAPSWSAPPPHPLVRRGQGGQWRHAGERPGPDATGWQHRWAGQAGQDLGSSGRGLGPPMMGRGRLKISGERTLRLAPSWEGWPAQACMAIKDQKSRCHTPHGHLHSRAGPTRPSPSSWRPAHSYLLLLTSLSPHPTAQSSRTTPQP
jgi:hypothetical protein